MRSNGKNEANLDCAVVWERRSQSMCGRLVKTKPTGVRSSGKDDSAIGWSGLVRQDEANRDLSVGKDEANRQVESGTRGIFKCLAPEGRDRSTRRYLLCFGRFRTLFFDGAEPDSRVGSSKETRQERSCFHHVLDGFRSWWVSLRSPHRHQLRNGSSITSRLSTRIVDQAKTVAGASYSHKQAGVRGSWGPSLRWQNQKARSGS